jgi:signal transduction histidine kinase
MQAAQRVRAASDRARRRLPGSTRGILAALKAAPRAAYRSVFVRLAVLVGVLLLVYAIDRALVSPSTTLWLAYVLPVVVAPRLVPLALVPGVLGFAMLLSGSEALLGGRPVGDELLRESLLLVIGLYALRDAHREEELEAAKDRLLRLVSHELRTPLHHIKGFASTLRQPDLDWDAATERECLAAIEESADRLTRLVDMLLDMARIEDCRLEPHREPCRLGDLVTAAVRAVPAAAAEHPLEVRVPAAYTLVDPIQIVHVLTNLIDNAAKYSPPGSPIWITGAAARGRVVVRVADRGIGIGPRERGRIFRRFERSAAARQSKVPGTGLGLTIAQELAAANGGRVWLEVSDARGSVFAVTLPAAGQ